jgi:hypothetical protein
MFHKHKNNNLNNLMHKVDSYNCSDSFFGNMIQCLRFKLDWNGITLMVYRMIATYLDLDVSHIKHMCFNNY